MRHPHGRATGLFCALIMVLSGSAARADEIGPPPDATQLAESHDLAVEGMMYANAVAARLQTASVTCWPESAKKNADPDNLFLPPSMPRPIDVERYWTDTTVWTGDLTQSTSGRAQRANFTYSFPPDGVTWGLASVSATGPNALNASLTTTFGAADIDEGREYLRQALASWRRYCGVTYSEVADDSAVMDQVTARTATRGDIRMGGRAFGTSSFLAYNAFPGPALAGVGGSDMCINTSFFTPNEFRNAADNYRYLRDTVAHEHGHGLGNIHSVPCNNTKLMEPFISTLFDAVQIDERRAGGRNYGDRYSGNNGPGTARNYGDLTSPVLRSVIEKNLSTNGSAGFSSSDQDWFKFTLSSTQNIVITATPTGGTYTAGQQSSSCTGSTSSINATNAGDLNLSLYLSDGTTLQQPAVNAFGPGFTETLTANALPAGTYYVRIKDNGPNPAANQTVQLYDMTLRVGAAKAPPEVNAGLNKRIAANTNCFFMGDINSAATESGATLSTYAWDLDGDGIFEIANNAKPSRQYTTNGVIPVTLRITDSNGMTATDTINVTVFGGVAGGVTVSSVSPNSGNQGAVIPVTINGTGFAGTVAANVSVSGSGVTVSGTAAVNGANTQITGLSFNVAAGATIGARNVVITNAQGTGTGTNAFTINLAPPASFGLVAPIHGTTNASLTPTFQWAPSTGAVSYTLKIDDAASLTTPLFTQTLIPGTSFVLPAGILANSTQYWWGVEAVNTAGFTNSSPISWVFTTQAPPLVPPGAFALASPAHGSTGVSLTPLFQWTTSADADTYTLKIDTNSALNSPIFTQSGIVGTSVALPSGLLAESTQYWWGVTATNADGSTDSTPAAFSFETESPPPPDCVGDTNGDNAVDILDISVLLASFGANVPAGTGADFNSDGVVDISDLSVLLGAFGVPC